MNDPAKEVVVTRIAGDRQWCKLPGTKWRVENSVLHVRFVTNPKSDGVSYAYDTNRNMLSADYAVWLCGNTSDYYLIPIDVIRRIHEDPKSYKSSHHPTHRVISVNIRTHQASFSTGPGSNFKPYFRATFLN